MADSENCKRQDEIEFWLTLIGGPKSIFAKHPKYKLYYYNYTQKN